MTLQTGQHIITIHTLPNIPSEGDHTIKFGNLVKFEYNMRNSFEIIHKMHDCEIIHKMCWIS